MLLLGLQSSFKEDPKHFMKFQYSTSQRFPKRQRGKRGGKGRFGERGKKKRKPLPSSHFKMAAVRGSVLTSAPLKATDVAAERWDSLKEKGDTCVLIDNLEEQGRNLEVRWQLSTIRDKCYEAEQSFKPTFAEDLFDKDKVKSLRVICASTIRCFGEQIKLDELPYECQILVKYLPKLLTPSSKEKNEAETLSTNNNSDNLADNGLLPRKRVLSSWMKQPTSELENRVNVTTVAENGKNQTVV